MNRKAPVGGLETMLSLVGELPEQLENSGSLVGLDGLSAMKRSWRHVLVCGMGGSAIAADLIVPLLADQKVGLSVWRDYGLPHWVDSEVLVIAQSYSGRTEECLSGVELARQRGCGLLALTSGGDLAGLALAAQETDPGVFPLVRRPGGLPPGASLGHGVGALLHFLGSLGVVPEAGLALKAASSHLRAAAGGRCRPHPGPDGETTSEQKELDGNLPARELAALLKGKIPVIFTAGQEAHAAGLRLKCQFNENSKVPAFWAQFPELNHNDIVGWRLSGSQRGRFVLLVVEQAGLDPRLSARVRVTKELLAEDFPEIVTLRAGGEHPLARIMSLVQYGDYLSCHLAELLGNDPLPVTRIDQLKAALEDE